MSNRNIIGSNVKLLRKRLGITQEDLAARLNILEIDIDRPMISKIENSSREVLDYEVKALAIALKVSINDLFK
ncbi:MAG: helix-turn-helix transcriptional regulator [Clostridium sp.]|uniref:helix-turn-helix domain-containing protein n=1 Tax=Clostridium sp. TaxID=1506 RepID=UPI0025C2FF68|nr:helix-turn-helix transcriptional regulator [Clostridium sp.]MBS4957668.1 helix-turn-helix transcriptional regulator [Clostridium sp.]